MGWGLAVRAGGANEKQQQHPPWQPKPSTSGETVSRPTREFPSASGTAAAPREGEGTSCCPCFCGCGRRRPSSALLPMPPFSTVMRTAPSTSVSRRRASRFARPLQVAGRVQSKPEESEEEDGGGSRSGGMHMSRSLRGGGCEVWIRREISTR